MVRLLRAFAAGPKAHAQALSVAAAQHKCSTLQYSTVVSLDSKTSPASVYTMVSLLQSHLPLFTVF